MLTGAARRRGAVVVVVVVVLLVAGVLAWRTWGSERGYSVAPPPVTGSGVDPTAASATLARLTSAMRDHDRQEASALAPADDPDAAALLDGVLANAASLEVVDFGARYIDQVSVVGDDGSWTATVDLTWRFAGFDTRPAHEEVQVAFRNARGADGASQVGITGFGGGDDRTPLWLTGPLQVRRTDRVLVLATTAADADLLAARASAAVTVVRRVLPGWTGPMVVEVPSGEEQLDAVLGADAGTYTAIAAVTASVDGQTTTGSPVHIFINPSLYDTLDPVGGQVVLSHETTHLATDAPLIAGLPSWLVEGFADYVALRDVDLPLSTTAGQILAEVRADGPPDHLPSSADFDAQATNLGATYEGAWLLCRVLADTGGEDALVRFYDRVSAGQPLDRELAADLGLTPRRLLAAWQQRLRRLAASTAPSPGAGSSSTPPPLAVPAA